MKLKVLPEDFQVLEESEVTLSAARAPYAVFRLAKTSWDTFDLIDVLARRMKVRRDDITVGGIKDRHGSSVQMVCLRGLRGAPRGFRERNFSLEFAGYASEPLSARNVKGNRFIITLRDIPARDVEALARAAEAAARDGIPNYYDEQRFGSARHKAGFMGKEVFLGHREKALRLFFTPSKHDDQKTRKLKKDVIENWGRWEACSAPAFGEYARILQYLRGNPRAFHRALALMDRRLMVFSINAYQSFLFNEILARFLVGLSTAKGFATRKLAYGYGDFIFHGELPAGLADELAQTTLPVPGYDSAIADPLVRSILDEVLEEEGITLSDLRVRQMQKMSAHGVDRMAVARPRGLLLSEDSEDELYPGKRKLKLEFSLPRGSYATILIKRLGLPGPGAM